jgi:hypothetical protein
MSDNFALSAARPSSNGGSWRRVNPCRGAQFCSEVARPIGFELVTSSFGGQGTKIKRPDLPDTLTHACGEKRDNLPGLFFGAE